ncbi:MAG: pyruvate kinase [Planctomycetota bacterium]|jgi:pyruvate kinase
MIKTKIIATLGPSSNRDGTIKAMIDNGVDVFRLNFSHGTLDEHAKWLETLNAVRTEHYHTTAVMGDLCGPKIRTGRIEPEGQVLCVGDEVIIVPGEEAGTKERFCTNYKHFAQDVHVGNRIFIDDGQIALRVLRKDDDDVVCEVVIGG